MKRVLFPKSAIGCFFFLWWILYWWFLMVVLMVVYDGGTGSLAGNEIISHLRLTEHSRTSAPACTSAHA